MENMGNLKNFTKIWEIKNHTIVMKPENAIKNLG